MRKDSEPRPAYDPTKGRRGAYAAKMKRGTASSAPGTSRATHRSMKLVSRSRATRNVKAIVEAAPIA